MTGFAWNWPIVFLVSLLVACLWLLGAALRKAKFRPNPIVIAVWSLWILWVALSPGWFRLNTALEGEIISAQGIPPTPRSPIRNQIYFARAGRSKRRVYCWSYF